MPYKHQNISYGLPHKEYPKERIAECTDQLIVTIGLQYEPVGITFLFTQEDFEAYPAQERTSCLPYCVMVKQAATQGKDIKSKLENHQCDGATTAFALEPSNEKIECGEEYFSYQLYSSVAVARRFRESIKSLHRMPVSTYGVAVVPLRQCEKTPDVIIVMTNAMQSMRLVQGYEYFSGKKPQIDMGAMQGMCSELTVSPYLTGEMNVSVLCPSTRMLCKWDDNQMGVGIPYELFETIVEGVVATVPSY